MLVWTLAKKELRMLLRDPRAMVVLLAMPLIFILVLGISLGDSFGQKPDDRLRISILDLDEGYVDPEEEKKPELNWSICGDANQVWLKAFRASARTWISRPRSPNRQCLDAEASTLLNAGSRRSLNRRGQDR